MIHGSVPETPLHQAGALSDWASRLPDVIDLANPPVGAFDAFAELLSEESGLPWAMVNWFGVVPEQQLFVGLSNPAGTDMPQADRTMPELTHGWCPDVYTNRRTLILNDTLAYANFATNPVIDEFGIRTYQGSPLIDHRTGQVWGTICAIGQNPRPRDVGRPARVLMEHYRDLLMTAVYERTPHP
ncbi:GAF domain-containing protein [Streptomyces sp. GC420]|uniref:GAF domain-containing protein n=1 Tax=Streptomyces sp. GC420 TaxID=2697568 RepID=UPI001414F5ED|nr:GAF domain-containing protein [Streptomyces sp. GC420]NBM14926.1 GAF domain-containing protein [Streptomyces sp. GC420]